MRGKVGLATDTIPLVFESGISATDISTFHVQVKVESVSAGVGALTPGAIALEHSWDDGATWSAIPNIVSQPITAAGIFLAYVTSSSGIVAPVVRCTVTAPAGESLVVERVRRSKFAPGQAVSFQPPGGSTATITQPQYLDVTGGVSSPTFAEYDSVDPTNNHGLPVVQLAGDGAAPVAVGAGNADSVTQRVVVATDQVSTLAQEATLTAGNALLTTIDADTGNIDTKLGSTNSLLTTIDADTSSIDTKLSTSNALLGTIDADTGSIDTHAAAIETSTGSIDSKITTSNTLLTTIDADTGSIDARLTDTNLKLDAIEVDTTSIDAKLPATLGQKAMAGSLAVALASDQTPLKTTKEGASKANEPYTRTYSSSNLSAGVWTQVVASTTAEVNKLHIFDSSGQRIQFGIGGAGAEVTQFIIPPGGIDVECKIPAGSRIALNPSVLLNVGELIINFMS